MTYRIANMATESDLRAAGLRPPETLPKKQRRHPEEDFQSAVIELAKLRGWRVYHTRDSRKSAPGFPDLTLVRAGRLVFAELKAGSELTPAQGDWLRAFRAVPGVEAYLWRLADWAEIERTLGAAA